MTYHIYIQFKKVKDELNISIYKRVKTYSMHNQIK